MYEQEQHRSVLVATIDRESDEVTFIILKIAGIFRGEYLIVEGNDLKTIEEIDNPETNRALRPMWKSEIVTESHREELESRLIYRTVVV
jgi:hypothetical protein